MRTWLLLTSIVVAAAAGAAQPARPTLRLPDAAEFPREDQQIISLLRTGVTVKLAAAALVSAPDSLDTLRLTAETRQSADVLQVLDRIVQTAPARIPEAFQFLTRHSTMFRPDDLRGEWKRLQEIIAAAKRRLGDLPREEAARGVRQLMFFEPYDVRAPDAQAVRLQAFLAEYAGTAAALEAQVDRLMAGRVSLQQLAELEAFAAAHPGTVAAAKATYQRGFQLAVNIPVTGVEKRGSDPTERFMQVLEIARQLESGEYPPSELVDRAPSIVTSFFASNPAYSPDNLDRVIEASYTFARAHFKPDPSAAEGGHIGYFLTGRMPALFKLKGDEVGGMDAMFSRLERETDLPAAATFLRAQYYLRGMIENPADRSTFLRKALGALEQLQSSGDGVYQRKALATLATVRFNERDFDGARADLLKYLSKYPDSDWAWVAATRAGLAAIELGQPVQAAVELDAAAVKYGATAVPRVLAHAYAARAEEAARRFDRALAQHRQALRAWDDDYGVSYSIYWRVRPPAGQFELGSDAALVVRTSLADRTAALAASLSRPQGHVLERGRWLLARERRREAIDILRPLVAGNTETARDARTLVHRAELEEALELAAADNPAANELDALARLGRLASEPLDFAVIAARMAEAGLIGKRGDLAQAETRTSKALADWHAQQRLENPDTPLERDVAEIRRAVFRPGGGEIYGSTQWNAFDWPASAHLPFAIVNPAVRVKLASGEMTQVTVQQFFSADWKVLLLRDEDLNLLRYLLAKLGGSKRRAPTAVMETPNQPVGASMDILALWNKFFAARPGHWGGWELETYPVVTQIEFTDDARTKAAAAVAVGYSGATVVLEKVGGRWVALRLTNHWVT